MKTAVVIDQQKIDRIKKKIQSKDYVDSAISNLAYEISVVYF